VEIELIDSKCISVTAVLLPPGQCCGCGTVSFGKRTSLSDNSNDHWRRLCLICWAAALCVWMLRALARNILAYLTYLFISCIWKIISKYVLDLLRCRRWWRNLKNSLQILTFERRFEHAISLWFLIRK